MKWLGLQVWISQPSGAIAWAHLDRYFGSNSEQSLCYSLGPSSITHSRALGSQVIAQEAQVTVYGSVGVWVCVDVCVGVWVRGCVCVGVGAWLGRCVAVWMCGCVPVCLCGCGKCGCEGVTVTTDVLNSDIMCCAKRLIHLSPVMKNACSN
jgi:hypothetical protein